MKQPPRGAIFETMELARVEFLRAVFNRLKDDVGTIFKLLEEHNKNSARKVGFWASIRLLMPIVEAIAHVESKSPQEFLRVSLGIKTPYLAWDLFRHSLIHGDYMQHAKYQTKQVGWGISFIGVGHVICSEHIGIDTIYLYRRLCNYLENEIGKNDLSKVKIEVGVIYKTPRPEIIDDFSEL